MWRWQRIVHEADGTGLNHFSVLELISLWNGDDVISGSALDLLGYFCYGETFVIEIQYFISICAEEIDFAEQKWFEVNSFF